jgi:PqqD family protein of HPr-rel-A system
MAQARPTARDDLTVLELDGEAVVLDPRSGDLHHLNATAFLLFESCDGATTISEIVHALSEASGTAPETIESDVRRALRGLRRAGLLEPVRAPAGTDRQ